MDKIKYIKTENEEGEISENIFISADAVNIDLDDGTNVQDKVTSIEETLENLVNSIADLQEQINNLDLTDYEKNENKVINLSDSSTDIQYPSAKCVYDLIAGAEEALDILIGGVE